MSANNNNENVSDAAPSAPEPNSSRTRQQSSSQKNAKAKGKRIKAASKPITKAQQMTGPVNFVVTKTLVDSRLEQYPDISLTKRDDILWCLPCKKQVGLAKTSTCRECSML